MSLLWHHPEPLLLASKSATRRQLIERAGLPIEAEGSGIDERAVEREAPATELAPRNVALRLAAAKALAVSRRRPSRIVIGADQTLDLDGELFHKPSNFEEAREQILRLAGKTHRLHAAVAIARDGAVLDSFVEVACMTMLPLCPSAVKRYLAIVGQDALTSVGAYQFEGLGVHLFREVEGSHSTILDLPLLPLLARLRTLGLAGL